MDDIFTYYVKMPEGINEWVCPCFEGYTVYLDESCLYDESKREKHFGHAVSHIVSDDFSKYVVSDIEEARH